MQHHNSGYVNADQEKANCDTIVSVSFPNVYRLAYYSAGGLKLAPGDPCMVQTRYGLELASVYSTQVPMKVLHCHRTLRPIKRVATSQDIEQHQKNLGLEQQAYGVCLNYIKHRKLPMKLVRVKFLFDRSKAIFYFTADGRIDFRELVKDLAGEFKTRIEMRQIGVRDEAKMIGGYGCCGLTLCCCTFLKDFEPVSIRMAKEQNLTLIPSKISGLCGRLMCCLNYEFETYREMKKQFPKVGKLVQTTKGKGRVIKVNVLRNTFLIDSEEGGIIELAKDELVKVFNRRKGPAHSKNNTSHDKRATKNERRNT